MTKQNQNDHSPNMENYTDERIREFWLNRDEEEVWGETEKVEVEVKKRERRPVSIRLTEQDIEALKDISEKRGVGYTTLIRMWVKERLKKVRLEERKARFSPVKRGQLQGIAEAFLTPFSGLGDKVSSTTMGLIANMTEVVEETSNVYFSQEDAGTSTEEERLDSPQTSSTDKAAHKLL